MQADGDGWTRCEAGHRHWGRYGAAGLLLRTRVDDAVRVLLQHRAAWTHHGGTWAVPGGAKSSWETPEQAALRETAEEVVVGLDGVVVDDVLCDDHGGWAYWTVIAHVPDERPAHPRNAETEAMAWLPPSDVDALELHPGFATTWPALRDRL